MTLKAWLKALRNSDNTMLQRYHSESCGFGFEGETFSEMHVSQLDLGGMDFVNTEWDACILRGINFSGTDLRGSFFNGCTIHDCLFDETELTDVSFDGCVLHRVVFKHLSFVDTELMDNQFKESIIENITFQDSTWLTTSLTGGKISTVRGSGQMRSVVMRDVSIYDFDTSDIEVENCRFFGEPTGIIPEGFIVRKGRRCRV